MMKAVRLPDPLHCRRCGYVWTPRVQVVTLCPKCKSKKWDEPKEAK